MTLLGKLSPLRAAKLLAAEIVFPLQHDTGGLSSAIWKTRHQPRSLDEFLVKSSITEARQDGPRPLGRTKSTL